MRNRAGGWIQVHVAVPRCWSCNGILLRFCLHASLERRAPRFICLHRFVYSAALGTPARRSQNFAKRLSACHMTKNRQPDFDPKLLPELPADSWR